MDIFKKFLEKAKIKKRKIGVGIIRPEKEVVESLKRGSQYADLVVVGSKIPGFECIPTKDDAEASQKLISLLEEKRVDGIVRGQLKDSRTLEEFFKQFKMKKLPHDKKVCPAILQSPDGRHQFVISECSIYHGMTLEGKIYQAERTIKYMEEELGIKPKIAVMSARRPTSVVGEYPLIEEIDERCLKLAEYLRKKGYEVKECYFEYETAIAWGANLVIPSLGMIGNAVFRALHYLCDWKLISCPYLDLGVVYEDGSRNEKDFFYHIVHAVAMANKKL